MAEQPAKVALALGTRNPTEIIALATNVANAMTGNETFPAPPVPLDELKVESSAYVAEEAAIAKEEIKLKARRTANRGKLAGVKKQLTTLGSYVNGVAQGRRAVVEAAGMPASAVPQPVGKLPKVTDLAAAPGGTASTVQLTWSAIARKDGCSGYMVFWGLVPGELTEKEYAHTANCLVKKLPSGKNVWFSVQPLGKESGDCCNPVMQMVP